ncbi:hypothetical protein [Phaeovulum sp.]|uniref:hypothetical protein n=1 Tax=Phaeovulum sp. TaxID=2934796 RepID=UPI002730CF60|nr:hypothetical protein [Phaeovulum sp.]MDP1668003.1 hypothetical protein [Phaeovulum sp.]MDZ4119452.1 hypothetical protein [Phaeovulum sp.]
MPEELRNIVGARELVEKDLPSDARKRARLALGIINGFLARIDAARETYQAHKNAPDLTLSVAAKTLFRNTLGTDEKKSASTAVMMAEHDQIVQRQAADEIGIFTRRKRHDQRGC